MMRTMIGSIAVAIASALLSPTPALAWGGFHAGYTHVGPAGVYHTGRTAVATPYGGYAGGHTSAYGAYGGAYHAGYGAGYRGGYGGAYGGYRYTPSYGGAYGGYRYGYVR